LAVEQARLGVQGAELALATATVLVQNAQEQLELADARYLSGAGSSIERGDAQVALTTALQQHVQSEFSLATTRASLLNALGTL
jgi:outer membrane protein